MSKKVKLKTTRINIIRTNDNRIMIDLKTLEQIISNHLVKLLQGNNKPSLDTATLIKVYEALSSINDTAIKRIEEQNVTSSKYNNNTIKEIELDLDELFE